MSDRTDYWIKYSSSQLPDDEIKLISEQSEWRKEFDTWRITNPYSRDEFERIHGTYDEQLYKRNLVLNKFDLYVKTAEEYITIKELEVHDTPIGRYVILQEPILFGSCGGGGHGSWGGEIPFFKDDILIVDGIGSRMIKKSPLHEGRNNK